MNMKLKNMLTVMTLTSSLVYGLPSRLAKEVEEAECAIMNLPARVSEEQLSRTQKKLESCLKKLNISLQKKYDEETERKILTLETDLQFLKECKKVLLKIDGIDSEIAQKWIKTGYTFECYLMHFSR